MSYFILPFYEIQTAIYQKLKASPHLQALGVEVYDTPDENTPYPYVTIGEPYSNPLDTKTNNCEQVSFTIHAWRKDNDESTGKRILYEILSACQQALLTRRYSINGLTVLDVTRNGAQVFDDVEVGLKHGVLTVRYKVQIN